jgi:hypothetical protein
MADEVLAQAVNKPLSTPLPTTPTQSLKALQDVAARESSAIEELGAAEAKKIRQEPMIKSQLKEAEAKYVSGEQEKRQKEIADAEYSMSQFKASKDSVEGFAILGSLIGALGMIAGNTGGKQSALNSIKSMTGMMQGYSKGRADEFRRNQIEFDKQFKIMQNKIERANKQFDQALALMPYNTVEAQKVADSAIAELNSDIVTAKYRQQGLVPTKELLGQALRSSEDAATRATQLAVAQLKSKVDVKLGPVLRNISEEYPEGTAEQLAGAEAKDKDRIYGSYRTIEESEDVARYIAQNPKAVGALAAIKNFVRLDSIKSVQDDKSDDMGLSRKQAIADQALEDAVKNKQISADTAEAAKLLQKRLFAIALADVQSSGQRGSIYLDKQFQNLYDQALRPRTLLNTIKTREEESNRNLRVYKLNIERNKNADRFPLHLMNTDDYIDKFAPALAVPDDVKKALDGKPEGTIAKKGDKRYIVSGGAVSTYEGE